MEIKLVDGADCSDSPPRIESCSPAFDPDETIIPGDYRVKALSLQNLRERFQKVKSCKISPKKENLIPPVEKLPPVIQKPILEQAKVKTPMPTTVKTPVQPPIAKAPIVKAPIQFKTPAVPEHAAKRKVVRSGIPVPKCYK